MQSTTQTLNHSWWRHCSDSFHVSLDLNHLFSWDPRFEDSLLKTPQTTLLQLERAAKILGEEITQRELASFELRLERKNWAAETLRSLSLQSKKVGELCKVSGMIVNCKKPGVKYKAVALQCRQCRHEVSLTISGYSIFSSFASQLICW